MDKLKIHTASSLPPTDATIWIYKNWIAQGELTVLAGPPGSGKTAFACAIAAGITIGMDYDLLSGFSPERQGDVFIINKEDDFSKTLIPRLKAAGADLDKIHFIGKEDPFSFSKEEDVRRLAAHAKRLGNNLELIIVDPIYFAVNGDKGNDAKSRNAYERLTSISKYFGCGILGIAHAVTNPMGKTALTRVAGAPALRQVPRSIILLNKITNGPTQSGGTHVLVHAKNNIGNEDGGFEYHLQEVDVGDNATPNLTLKFEITGERSETAENILTVSDYRKQANIGEKGKNAKDFLLNALKDGPVLWIDIKDRAMEENIKLGTLKSEATKLGIKMRKRDGDGRSVWTLANFKDESLKSQDDTSQL